MKIHPDQLTAIEQEQAKSKRTQEAGKGFGDVLAEEVSKTAETTSSQATVRPPGMDLSTQILASQAAAQTGETSDSGQAAMEKLENLMGEWEDYAARLDSSSGNLNLRQANGMLESIETGVNELKQDMPGLSEENAGLSDMVNELEILAVTERVKFNRGDYLA